MFIGEPGGSNRSRVSNRSRGVWHFCSNRSRGLLLEEIRYGNIFNFNADVIFLILFKRSSVYLFLCKALPLGADKVLTVSHEYPIAVFICSAC